MAEKKSKKNLLIIVAIVLGVIAYQKCPWVISKLNKDAVCACSESCKCGEDCKCDDCGCANCPA
jgi:hypothetical protein